MARPRRVLRLPPGRRGGQLDHDAEAGGLLHPRRPCSALSAPSAAPFRFIFTLGPKVAVYSSTQPAQLLLQTGRLIAAAAFRFFCFLPLPLVAMDMDRLFTKRSVVVADLPSLTPFVGRLRRPGCFAN